MHAATICIQAATVDTQAATVCTQVPTAEVFKMILLCGDDTAAARLLPSLLEGGALTLPQTVALTLTLPRP